MPAEPSKSLSERRAELEKQLRELTDRRDPLYMPGMTVVPGQLSATDEQTESSRSRNCKRPSRKSMKS